MTLAFFVLPAIVVTPDDLLEKIDTPPGFQNGTAPTGVDLVQARNGVRTAGVALIAGIGAALATGFAGRTYYLSRRGQLSDRYTAATEQLRASDAAAQVSAIGELERLANESPAYRNQVAGVLATFLRSQKPRPQSYETPPAPPAVQAAFVALARRRSRRRRYDRRIVIDLAQADLRRVRCDRAQLRDAILRDAKLAGAFLGRSDLRGADLKNAVASSVRLEHADLRHAIFEGAHLDGATLDAADARHGAFKDVQLQHTSMRRTDLRDATDLPRDQSGGVSGAIIDPEKTRLPALAHAP